MKRPPRRRIQRRRKKPKLISPKGIRKRRKLMAKIAALKAGLFLKQDSDND